MIKLHAEGVPRPAAIACISPHTDLAGTGDSMRTRASVDPYLTPKGNERLVDAYLKDIDEDDPRVSAIYADLTGLPPLLIQVGTDEILYDDSTRLRDRAEYFGVDCTYCEWDRMWHVWHSFACRLRKGRKGIEQLGRFINVHL